MSAFIIVTISDTSINCNSLSADLHLLSKKLNIGIFDKERYIERFESERDYNYSFSIADSDKYDNSDRLTAPWWYINCSEKLFEINMNNIKTILDVCFSYTPKVDMWIGTSGDMICDFENHSIQIDEYLSDIKLRYTESGGASPPPSVHYVISK